MLSQHRIHAIQGTIRRQDALTQDLRQANHLERGGTTLGVASQGLLRNHVHRVAVVASHRGSNALVQIRLVRVIRIGRGVVLGDDGHLIRRDAMRTQGLRQAGIHAATGRRQRAQSRRGDGGVSAVREGLREGHHAQNRQSLLRGE